MPSERRQSRTPCRRPQAQQPLVPEQRLPREPLPAPLQRRTHPRAPREPALRQQPEPRQPELQELGPEPGQRQR